MSEDLFVRHLIFDMNRSDHSKCDLYNSKSVLGYKSTDVLVYTVLTLTENLFLQKNYLT